MALWLAISAFVLFRLSYLFVIGQGLKHAIFTHPKIVRHDRKWLKFKTKSQWLLRLDGLSFLLVTLLSMGSFPDAVSAMFSRVVGGALIVVGLVSKVSAYWAIGEKGYYWYNFFCSNRDIHFEQKGIYRYLSNPMYGVGYMHVLGLATLLRSTPGVAAFVFAWTVVWIFYFVYEYPHTKKFNPSESTGH